MKYQKTPAFDGDLRRLSPTELAQFRKVVREHFIPAAERRTGGPAQRWPASLRVRHVEGAKGIWEMTWSFSGPDGRATWEWVTIGGAPAIRWRRVGGHSIFSDP